MAVSNQYVKLLQEYRDFLDTAQHKLQFTEITALNFINLKHQLEAHNVCIIKTNCISVGVGVAVCV